MVVMDLEANGDGVEANGAALLGYGLGGAAWAMEFLATV